MVKAGSKMVPRRGRLDPARVVLRGRTGRLAGAFIAPALTIYLLIIVAPAIGTLWISFTKWKGIGDEAKWVGTDNYLQLWRNDVFRDSFERTLLVLVPAASPSSSAGSYSPCCSGRCGPSGSSAP